MIFTILCAKTNTDSQPMFSFAGFQKTVYLRLCLPTRSVSREDHVTQFNRCSALSRSRSTVEARTCGNRLESQEPLLYSCVFSFYLFLEFGRIFFKTGNGILITFYTYPTHYIFFFYLRIFWFIKPQNGFEFYIIPPQLSGYNSSPFLFYLEGKKIQLCFEAPYISYNTVSCFLYS